MKLLLVDDELMTREGIYDMIPWHDFGIEEVERADDGVNGLGVAKRFNPDIVLTDVRMPRMDGIEMANAIRSQYPNCILIFMSGFSDKEYLKSAIQLSAVHYVEKPIDLDELKQAIEKAVSIYNENEERKRKESLLYDRLQKSIPIMNNDIALKLTRQGSAQEQTIEFIRMIYPYIDIEAEYVTLLIRLLPNEMYADSVQKFDRLNAVYHFVYEIVQQGDRDVFIGLKQDSYVVVHFNTEVRDDTFITHMTVEDLLLALATSLIDKGYEVQLAVGEKVQGIANVYHSYVTAVLALQKLFFHPEEIILFYEMDGVSEYKVTPQLYDQFAHCLEMLDQNKAVLFVKELTEEVRKHDQTLINDVKAMYVHLVNTLFQHGQERGLPNIGDWDKKVVQKRMEKLYDIASLERETIAYVQAYFQTLHEKGGNRKVVSDVIKYINENFHNEQLSLQEIANQVHLSPTYLCVVYKQETGKTINQVLIDIRIREAKRLLKSTHLKVKDVTMRVGYKDSNYFSKLFRKHTGYTPLEYRKAFFR